MAKKAVKKAAPKKAAKVAPKKTTKKNQNEAKAAKAFEQIVEKEMEIAIQPIRDLIKKHSKIDLGFKLFVVDHKNGYMASVSDHVSITGETNIAKKAHQEAEASLTEMMLEQALKRVKEKKS